MEKFNAHSGVALGDLTKNWGTGKRLNAKMKGHIKKKPLCETVQKSLLAAK